MLVSVWGWRGAYVALGITTLLVTFPAATMATRNVPGPAHRGDAVASIPIGAMLRTRRSY